MEYYYLRNSNNKRLNELGSMLKAPLVDRTSTITNECSVLSELPTMPNTVLDYDTICDDRAKGLLKRSEDENLELRVAYSGGMDSTTALVGLLKFKGDYPNADIKVCMNQKSIDEYPWFYENHIKDKLDVYMGETFAEEGVGENEALGLNFSKDTGKDYLIVTGELGDQIFGAKIVLLAPEKANTHYKDEFNRHTIDLIKGLVDKMPILDETCGGVLSWLNFTLKYQWCQLRMYCMFDIPYEKYEHFFDTTEFQQWSMSNPMSVKFPDYDPTKYKLPTKNYIRGFTKDGLYYDRKEKVPSMQTTVKVFGKENATWTSIDENMNKAYIDRPIRKFINTESGAGVSAQLNNIKIEN